jgi:CheY-like chemotaxis protein
MNTITCILIDDDPEDRLIFGLALEEVEKGIIYYPFTNLDEVLNGLNSDNGETVVPDFLFLDLNMPVYNGKECLGKLRGLECYKEVPIIIYSTSSEDRDIKETQILGANHYLTKPSDLEKLVSILGPVLRKEKLSYVLNNVLC